MNLKEVANFYDNKARNFGKTIKALGWSNKRPVRLI